MKRKTKTCKYKNRICGELGTLPPFQWYVDNTKYPPSDADVSVIMKNIGLNDGKDEGIAFTLSGRLIEIKTKKKKKTIGHLM